MNSTDVERKLWYRLRDRRFFGLKFRRQVPVGPFIADFACADRKLIVELDGGQHASIVDADLQRTAWLEKDGWRVIRYWNNDVVENLDGVLEHLANLLGIEAGPCPHPDPLPQAGEGEEKERRRGRNPC